MELSETDERILLENIVDVARLDEEVIGIDYEWFFSLHSL